MRRIFSDPKRMTAFFLAAVMCFALLSAVCVIGTASDHICTGDDCAVCCQISKCENLLRFSGCISAFFVSAAIIMLFYAFLKHYSERFSENITLVSLNVKLSD